MNTYRNQKNMEPSPPLRYTYREIPLSLAEARRLKAEVIRSAKAELRYREEQLQEAKENLIAAQRSSLRDSHTEQITLYPGDPGYDEAPATFDERSYAEDFEWLNTSSETL